MDKVEAALRDEIAWHKHMIETATLYGSTTEPMHHRARLAALTAALPAPGVDAADRLRDAVVDAIEQHTGYAETWCEGLADKVLAAIAAAPEPPQ